MAKEVMVYQANPLVEARRDFSLIEARIFYLGLRDVVPRLTEKLKIWGREKASSDFPTTVLSTKELVQMFGSHQYYSTLKGISKDLARKVVEIKEDVEDGEEGYSLCPVFHKLTYSKSKGLILKFSPEMIPFLLDLANRPFTKLPFEQVIALHSPYSIRLFELLLQYQNTKTHERKLAVEELRYCLGVPDDTYSTMDNFKRRVLESSIRDINENTKFKVEYENVKEGRKIVAFNFKLHLPAELKKEKRKKQIADVLQLAKDTVKPMTEEKPTISDEQRARNQERLKELMGSIKGM